MSATIAPIIEAKPLRQTHGNVRNWLFWIAFLVFLMVMIGGITRLTDSGLSITEWQPLMGALPPLQDADWNLLFEKYKHSSEFKLQNNWMQLADFKRIFWWEWVHRNFGRFIGVAYLLPLLYFIARKNVAWRLVPALLLLFVLGGMQGLLGWFMVKSGLSDRTDVSHYRLAAHFLAASVLFASILWVAFGIGWNRKRLGSFNSLVALLLLLLIFVQLAAGALMAGLDAGHVSDTWPKMLDAWIPSGLTVLKPLWKNAVDNALTVHFDHRMLAYAVLIFSTLHAWHAFNMSSMILAYATFTQVTLGIFLVILRIPTGMALAHQTIAMCVLAAAVWNLHRQLAVEYTGKTEEPAKPVLKPKIVPSLQ